ncbi:ATP-binding protein [Aporhodopirellula aestuarii]|uniref:histidine kinase n=1 Tax=Aporhodopirellula aestuarii TaxID=2950107 RepID=A0ABT0U816_9BACT|nr:ATP-binding protein [Aporhodopirellula aestuarii]MCM2373084.1 ATP-binding protein [Aporhodopirellula aestuarii]
MASLFVIRGRDQGKHFQIAAPVTRLGRDSTNDIQLLDNEASRGHAEIRGDLTAGRYELIDLGSSNGTFVNSDRVSRRELVSGDRIEIGGTLLIFTGGGNVAAMDAAHGVDIVRQVRAGDASRIVSSFSRGGVARGRTPGGSPASEILAKGRRSKASPSSTSKSSGDKSAVRKVESPPENIDRTKPVADDLGDQVSLDESASSVIQTLHEPTKSFLDTDQSLEVMYLTALAVGRTDDLNEVLDRVLKLIFDWLEADRGCVMLRDPETKRLTPAARCDREQSRSASSNPGKPAKPPGRITISHTILDYVLQHKEGVRTSDAVDDERFDNAASIVQGGVREALCVPLQGRYDVVGALYVDTYTPPGEWIQKKGATRFHDEHLKLITAIGHQAALAIEDTFYYSALLQGERLAAMGQTIATLSHHIKNILQGVRGGSYLIESGLSKGDTEAIRRGWAIVDRNQERISNLVLDMLTFSKEREPQRVDADLNATITDVLELMQGRADESDIRLQRDLEEDLPTASFDPDAIHRALLNLITNAIDAAESSIRVSSRFDAAVGWIVDVEDDGEGVDEDEREQIFSLFESKKGARGTGLGLPVTAKIMQEHGGSIEVTNAADGGACFRMILPTVGTDINNVSGRETQI